MSGARQKSGLTRVSTRLLDELGDAVTPVVWDGRKHAWMDAASRKAVALQATDWLLTVELFSGAERPGLREFIAAPPCRLAAMFHDAIPLRWPHITWPQSVQRHPDYMKLLAGFDRVFAVSEASRRDLMEFWRWQGVAVKAQVQTVELGADFDGSPRVVASPVPARASLLCVGIIEPRKNQAFLLEVCAALWREGLDFDLHVVGRVNPHFGAPIERQLKQAQKREQRLRYHAQASDAVLAKLYAEASAVVFPTIAEGCGLPLLESLWRGVPCVGSDLPVLRENADAGGCLMVEVNDADGWRRQLRAVLTEAALQQRLSAEAAKRGLPRWADTAKTLRAALG
ncbi:MAG: glycosyltransferase [Opitutae bacterium]|nr:glycosyltransferase [Opitutae bacterium]